MVTLEKITEQCNSLISLRNEFSSYFVLPDEFGRKRFSIIHWSNAKKKWAISGLTKSYGYKLKEPYPLLKLNCENVYLPYSKTVIEKIIKDLIPHPLYNKSFEARKI